MSQGAIPSAADLSWTRWSELCAKVAHQRTICSSPDKIPRNWASVKMEAPPNAPPFASRTMVEIT